VFSPSDTIVALATAPAPAGLGVVRLSGPHAAAIARAMLTPGQDLEPRRATLTRVVASDPAAQARAATPATAAGQRAVVEAGFSRLPSNIHTRAIDEVVVTFFPGPQSYTAEDVVEISAHGSLALLSEIVAAAMAGGARLAEPGEFTLRAFLNGRLDLVQAEAVGDLVNAVTPLQARVAFDQLDGTLTRAIAALDAQLFELAAKLEASVDFPDEGYHFIAAGEVEAALVRVRDGLDQLLASYARGRLIREGRHIAILGKPNVGKSTLFNALVGTDRAIVTAIPGTTRDLLRETIDFEGVRLGLVDTAGIRPTDDEVEREGVARARGAGGAADVVLLMLDRSRALAAEDLALLRETSGARRIVVVNKSDLAPAWDAGDLSRWQGRSVPAAGGTSDAGAGRTGRGPVLVSLKTGAGMDAMRQALRETLGLRGGTAAGVETRASDADVQRDAPIVSNLRHAALLAEARASIVRAVENLIAAGEQASEELVIADLAGARRAFEAVTGRRTSEDVLRHIFANFCVGK